VRSGNIAARVGREFDEKASTCTDVRDPHLASEYPVLAPEGFLSDLKAAHEIQDDTLVNVGYGLLDGWPPPNLQDNEDRWYSTSPYRG